MCIRDSLYTEPVEIKDLTLQESEVEEVIWMDYEECRKQVESGELANLSLIHI